MNSLLTFIAHSFILLPFLILVVQNILPRKSARRMCRGFCVALSAAQILTSITAAVIFFTHDIAGFRFGLFSGEEAYLGFDITSLVIIFCIALAGLASALVSFTTENDCRMNYSNLFAVLVLSMNCITLVNDLFSMYVFLEVIGVASFVQIALPKDRDALHLEGAYKYLILSSLASIFVLAGLAIIYLMTGTLNINTLSDFHISSIAGGDYYLMVFGILMTAAGFATKAGVAPFHGWVPDAYQASSGAVSVMLAGCVNKAAGAYGLIRIVGLIFTDLPEINLILALLGLVSILVGAFTAYRQTNLKRMLAYSSVSQMGYILMGVCAGPLGVVGAVLHTLNHTIFKSTLFVNVSAIKSRTGTLAIDDLGGLQSRMPVTGTTSILAFLSTAGIPPLSGFWSKLIIIIAVWQNVHPVCAGIALFASILTAVYFLRMQGGVFFGDLKKGLENIKEAAGNYITGEIILTAITVGLGIGFPWLLKLLESSGLI